MRGSRRKRGKSLSSQCKAIVICKRNKNLRIFCAMDISVLAAPVGCLRPCSQPWSILIETPSRTANWARESHDAFCAEMTGE
jgi:hypothetical protein